MKKNSKKEQELLSLVQKDAPEKSDAIVWLQGDKYDRARGVLDLFLKKFADKIIISGNNELIDKKPGEKGVALEKMAAWLVERGVPGEKIIIDAESLNTRGQAENVLEIASKNGWRKIILVASLYHQPRVFLTFLKRIKEVAWEGKIINQPVLFNWETNPGGKNQPGKDLFFVEMEKIRKYKNHNVSFDEGISCIKIWQNR